MSNIPSQIRKALALVATVFTIAALSLVGTTSANANGVTYTVRLTSAGAVDQGSQGWFSFYPAGIAYNIKHVDLGSTTTLTYKVTDGVTAVEGATVTFVFNKAYSGSTAHTSVGEAIGSGDSDTKVTGVTDANGDVSFTLVNTDTTAQGAKTFSQVAAYVDSAVDAFDVTDMIFDPLVAPTTANIRIIAADRLHMSDKGYWCPGCLVKFVEAGSVLTLNYLVTDGSDAPIVGTQVTLVKLPTGVGAFTGDLTATTNASGIATFTLTNTNDSSQAEPRPVAPSSMDWWDDSRVVNPEVGMRFNVSISSAVAAVQNTDAVLSHVVVAASTPTPTPTPTPTLKKPAITSAVSISGSAKVGKSLRANKGVWTGSPSVTYKWFACSAKATTATLTVPSNCKAISGATKSSVALKSAQLRKYIRVLVMATNLAGKTQSLSKSSAITK